MSCPLQIPRWQKNLFVLGQYFYNEDYTQKSKRMLNNIKQNALTGGGVLRKLGYLDGLVCRSAL